MNHLAEHHENMLIEELSIAPEIMASRGYRTVEKKVELKELERTYRPTRRKIAPELPGVFLMEPDVCEVETISRWGLVAKCHASRKVVAS